MGNKNKKTQEQLLNRILINIGIAILAYIFLYVLYIKFYMIPSITFGIVFLVIAAAGYILSKVKGLKLKNYSHMFLGFSLAMFFTGLSRIASLILGFDRFIDLVSTYPFFEKLVNSRYEVILVSYLGGIYLIIMLIYNIVMIHKASK